MKCEFDEKKEKGRREKLKMSTEEKKKKIEHFMTIILSFRKNVITIQQQKRVGITFRKLFDSDNNTQLLKTK